MYDSEYLRQLRKQCTLCSIDFTRARITTVGSRYKVTFDPPLFSLGPWLESLPEAEETSSPLHAEGYMLDGLLKIQRAERQRLRSGRVHGWPIDQINRRPLSEQEISDYRALLKHQAEVKKLQDELAEALRTSADKAIAQHGLADLKSRYPLGSTTPAPTPAGASAVPNIPSKRKGVKS